MYSYVQSIPSDNMLFLDLHRKLSKLSRVTKYKAAMISVYWQLLVH
jgi:hypothetical protein